MELKVLRSFLVVAREQSISRAAKLLHISQPSLSRQIMDLEDELGTKLFERGNRKIAITEEGQLLCKRAEQIIELVTKTEEELTFVDKVISGIIHIGAGETFAFYTVAQKIYNMTLKYPDIRFHIFSGNAEDVREKLDKGLVDFGLLIEPYDIDKYDYIRLPDIDRWGVLMRQDSPLAKLHAIQAENLWNVPLICSRQALEGSQLSSWLKMDYEKLNIISSYNLLYNASLMVEAGVGYALCLDNIIHSTEKRNLCFRLLNPVLESRVNLVWKKHQIFSKPSVLFLNSLRNNT